MSHLYNKPYCVGPNCHFLCFIELMCMLICMHIGKKNWDIFTEKRIQFEFNKRSHDKTLEPFCESIQRLLSLTSCLLVQPYHLKFVHHIGPFFLILNLEIEGEIAGKFNTLIVIFNSIIMQARKPQDKVPKPSHDLNF